MMNIIMLNDSDMNQVIKILKEEERDLRENRNNRIKASNLHQIIKKFR